MKRLLAFGVMMSACGQDGGSGPVAPPPPPPPPPAPTSVSWTFCDPSHTPIWLAFQDSTGGWTRVQPGATGAYGFQLAHATGAVAWVTNRIGQGPWLEVNYASAPELAALGTSWCADHPDRSNHLLVSVRGLAPGEYARVSLGAASADVAPNDFPVPITGVLAGAQDLVALTFGAGPPVAIVRRAVDLPNDAVVPVLDFPAVGRPVPTAVVAVANAGADLTSLTETFVGAHGAETYFSSAFAVRPAGEVGYGLPAGEAQPGELYLFRVSALKTNQSVIRDALRASASFGNQSVTLGPDPSAPTVTTVASAPSLRFRAAGTVDAAYGSTITVGWQQQTGVGGTPQAMLTVTRKYLGASTTFDLVIPDLSGVAGWDAAWGLVAGASTFWYLKESGVNGTLRDGFVELRAAIAGVAP